MTPPRPDTSKPDAGSSPWWAFAFIIPIALIIGLAVWIDHNVDNCDGVLVLRVVPPGYACVQEYRPDKP